MKNYVVLSLLFLLVSISTVALYDAFILTPQLTKLQVYVIDVDNILQSSENAAKKGEITIETYKKRLKKAEEIIGAYPNLVLKKYIITETDSYAVAFGGKDISQNIRKQIEVIE